MVSYSLRIPFVPLGDSAESKRFSHFYVLRCSNMHRPRELTIISEERTVYYLTQLLWPYFISRQDSCAVPRPRRLSKEHISVVGETGCREGSWLAAIFPLLLPSTPHPDEYSACILQPGV